MYDYRYLCLVIGYVTMPYHVQRLYGVVLHFVRGLKESCRGLFKFNISPKKKSRQASLNIASLVANTRTTKSLFKYPVSTA